MSTAILKRSLAAFTILSCPIPISISTPTPTPTPLPIPQALLKRSLAAFTKVHLKAGEATRVSLQADAAALEGVVRAGGGAISVRVSGDELRVGALRCAL